jgi:hypothetical protein
MVQNMGTIRRKEVWLQASILRDYTLNIPNLTMKLTPDWICGFVEGEGSFVVSITEIKSSKSTQVRLFFKVAQHVKNVQLLYALKTFFGVGIVKRQTASRPDAVWEYVVSRFEHLDSKIIPFFESNTMHSTKKFDFFRFRRVAIMMKRKDHLTKEGAATKIKSIALLMNKSVAYPEPECGQEDL